MCGDWISLDDEVQRILKGLAVAPGEESETTATAQAGEGRAHRRAGSEGVPSATILDLEKGRDFFRRPASFKGGEHQTVAARDAATRQTVPLRIRR